MATVPQKPASTPDPTWSPGSEWTMTWDDDFRQGGSLGKWNVITGGLG